VYKMSIRLSLLMILMLPVTSAVAQMPNPYGEPINVDSAKTVVVPAIAEARKNKWAVAVAIVDIGGELVYFEKMDGTQTGSVKVSIEKARTAVLFKRPTQSFEEAVATGGAAGLPMLGLRTAVPLEGGIPLVMGGKIVGAIGVSGATSAQDGQCAKMGTNALK
jgi:glc operon protein GlcG